MRHGWRASSTGPSALSEAQARRPFLRAALLPHLLKPAVLEVPQTSHAACGSVNAVLPCCKEADPANLDRWEENHMSAFLTATFHVIGVFSLLPTTLQSCSCPLDCVHFAYAALRRCAQSCAGDCTRSCPRLMEPLAY